MSGRYTCGHCHTFGHTRDTCPTMPKRKLPSGWSSKNGAYAANRAVGRCDDCGAPSKRYARCKHCRDRRKRWPSRQASYCRKHERRARSKP